jgi:hypothetical protein
MKLLREYIRTLLEWEANFGEKLWAKLAKPDSRHFGDEPDTEEEFKLRKRILNHVDENGNLTRDTIRVMLQAAEDPRYNDAIMKYTGPAYRGIAVSDFWLDKHLPEGWDATPQFNPRANKQGAPIKGNPLAVNFTYMPRYRAKASDVGEADVVDSWTESPGKAELFAEKSYRGVTADGPQRLTWYPVVLKTEATDSPPWIDLNETLKQYSPSWFPGMYVGEYEVVTNAQQIQVTEIYITRAVRPSNTERE